MSPLALQRLSGLVLALVTLLLCADSAFLAATSDAGAVVAFAVRLHLWLGAALLVVLPVFVGSHVRTHLNHSNQAARNRGLMVAVLAGLGSLAGVVLWWVGKSSAVWGLTWFHELCFLVALLAYLAHRLRARVTPAMAGEKVGALAVLGLTLIIGAAALFTTGNVVVERPLLNPGLSEAGTVDGHLLNIEQLTDSAYCAECHSEVAERWESSAHRVSSLNDPFYAATLAFAQKHRSPEQLSFCGGCHDPALFFGGEMSAHHPVPGQPRTEVGIPCLGCHGVVKTPGLLGNGSYVLADPEHYPGYGSEDPAEQEENRRLIRSRPGKHLAAFGPTYLRTSLACAPCHKAHIPPELNQHRWLRGQNDFDPWFDSGAGANSARTFFPPKGPKRCSGCHMPQIDSDDPAARDGKIADHAFPGANTALPAVLHDAEWLARNEAFLKDVLTADIGAVRTESSTVLAPGPEVVVSAGESVTLDVVVRNVGSGHLFPGGVADLREVWLEVTVADATGVRLVTGWLDAEGHLDPAAHRWVSVLLDATGKVLKVHEVEDLYVVLYARRIMLGASDVVQITFDVPAGPATVTARVLHRKFARDYVEFALGEDAPRMPVTEMARTSLVFGRVDTQGENRGPRLRNLGVAHLLRGDTVAARAASSAAAEAMPTTHGPHHDLARGALADGDLESAEAHVRVADVHSPGHATGAWLLGRIRAGQGRQQEAVAAFDLALASFPRDREVLTAKGQALFKLEREQEAADTMERVLTIDPEHLGAHALLARIRTSLGDEQAAARHQEAWDRYRPHSNDRAVTEAARLADPALDRRSNQQALVPLAPPSTGWTPAL